MRGSLLAALLGLLVMLAAGKEDLGLQNFNLTQFSGMWYEIALASNLENQSSSPGRKVGAVIVEQDGPHLALTSVSDHMNLCMKEKNQAVKGDAPGKFKLPLDSGGKEVIVVATDYKTYAVMSIVLHGGEKPSRVLKLYSRTLEHNEKATEKFVEKAVEQGLSVSDVQLLTKDCDPGQARGEERAPPACAPRLRPPPAPPACAPRLRPPRSPAPGARAGPAPPRWPRRALRPEQAPPLSSRPSLCPAPPLRSGPPSPRPAPRPFPSGPALRRPGVGQPAGSPRRASHGEPGPVPGGRRRGQQAPGTRRVHRVPVECFREGRFRLCHRHRHDLRPADAGSEEASIPLSVEGAAGCGRRLSSQLLGDACGVAEVQQTLALPGDRAAPQRHGHRSAQLGALQPGTEDLGPDNSRTQPLAPLHPRLALPTPVAPTHRHDQVC